MTSTNEEPTDTIIKINRARRPRYTKEYKEEVLGAYEVSGMAGPAFAARCGLKYPTFATWVAKRRREKDGSADGSADGARAESFIFAEIGVDSGAGALRVTLPGGAVAEFGSPSQAALLAALIKALA